MRAAVGLSASMTPRLVAPREHRSRVIRIPGLGRIALSRDIGEGDLFQSHMLQTKLRAVVRGPSGELVEERDLGSGKVTNAGVMALANDAAWAQVSGAPVNTLAACKWHAWGTGTTAEKVEQLRLITLAAPTTVNAVEANGGANVAKFAANSQKLLSTGKIEEAEVGPVAITEWGLFSAKPLNPAQGTATAKTATSLTGTGTPFTASGATTRGEQNNIVICEKSESAGGEVFGLITASSTSVLTVSGWFKATDGTAGTEPEATSKYRVVPVMFDRRKFEPVNVSEHNTVEFPWELKIESGG